MWESFEKSLNFSTLQHLIRKCVKFCFFNLMKSSMKHMPFQQCLEKLKTICSCCCLPFLVKQTNVMFVLQFRIVFSFILHKRKWNHRMFGNTSAHSKKYYFSLLSYSYIHLSLQYFMGVLKKQFSFHYTMPSRYIVNVSCKLCFVIVKT